MNSAFIFGFTFPEFNNLIEKIILEMKKFDNIFIVTTEDYMYLNTSRVHCYTIPDIYSLKYQNDSDTEIPPLDESVIQEYADCEQICLKMFDKIEAHYRKPISYEKRKEMYLAHLKFWNYMIEKYNITFMLRDQSPHQVFDWIIFCIMKKRKANMFFFDTFSVFFNNRFIVDSDFYNFPILTMKYKQFLGNYNHNVSNEVLDYYQKQNQKYEDIPPLFYMPKQKPNTLMDKISSKLKNCKSFIFNPSLRKGLFYSKLETRKREKYITNYNKQAQKPCKGEKYVYLALHFQPENTTSPLAGAYVDQYLIVDLLSYYLPTDVIIYVKEHPSQTYIGRSDDYFSKIKAYKNVRLIRSDVNTHSLIDGAVCVCSCTGTVCLEAIIRKKPVIMFGNFIYQLAPGVFPVKTASQLQDALNTIFVKNFSVNPLQVQSFLQFLYQDAIEGFADPTFEIGGNISREQNCINILKAIKEILP